MGAHSTLKYYTVKTRTISSSTHFFYKIMILKINAQLLEAATKIAGNGAGKSQIVYLISKLYFLASRMYKVQQLYFTLTVLFVPCYLYIGLIKKFDNVIEKIKTLIFSKKTLLCEWYRLLDPKSQYLLGVKGTLEIAKYQVFVIKSLW